MARQMDAHLYLEAVGGKGEVLEVSAQGSEIRGRRQLPGDQLLQVLTLFDLWLQEVWQQSEREPGANYSSGP